MIRQATVVAVHVLFSLGCAPGPRAPSPPAAASPQASGLAEGPAYGCAAPVYRRLDFWLGTWDVTTPDGRYDGSNVIESTLGGCAIQEHWVEPDGHRGESFFYVDPASGGWRQVWATDAGPIKEKREEPSGDGSIRFSGTRDRTTLTPLPDGKVRQVIAPLAGGDAWTGVYTRVPSKCTTAESRQFDFWLGDWSVKVKSRASLDKEEWSAPAPGSNHVTTILGGCAVQERFTAVGATGLPTWSGRSQSTWVATEKRWRQTWVDDSGGYLAFTGGIQHGEMVLVGEPAPGGRVMRMVFADIAKDRFTWRWEASADGQKTWRTMMIIEYARAQSPQ